MEKEQQLFQSLTSQEGQETTEWERDGKKKNNHRVGHVHLQESIS